MKPNGNRCEGFLCVEHRINGKKRRRRSSPKPRVALRTLGMRRLRSLFYAEGVTPGVSNTFGVHFSWGLGNPGCAARPWALDWNAFGVALPFNPVFYAKVLHSVAQRGSTDPQWNADGVC